MTRLRAWFARWLDGHDTPYPPCPHHDPTPETLARIKANVMEQIEKETRNV